MSYQKQFVATEEAKGKAKQLRLFAFLAWLLGIAGQIFAIFKLINNETLVWLIVAIVAILALSITGSLLWKKANRLDPASEANKTKFFIQSQLGAIMGVLSFLPLVILIFLNKDVDGKTKGIAGVIAIVAMLAAGITGIDFNPPSVEKYTEQINAQTDQVTELTGGIDRVYWTPSGNKLHIYEDCHHIKNSDISTGTVKNAWEARGIANNEVCKTCAKRTNNGKSIPSVEDSDIEEVDEVLEGESILG